MKRKIVIVLLIAAAIISLPCFAVCRFVYVHLKRGYDDAERAAATRPATMTVASTIEKPAPQGSVDFDKLDFSGNTIEASNRTDHFVANLPPQHGSGKWGYRDGMIEQGRFTVLLI